MGLGGGRRSCSLSSLEAAQLLLEEAVMPDICTVRVTIYPSGYCHELEFVAKDLPAARLLSEYLQVKGVECRVASRYLHDGEKCPVCGREDLRGQL